jgi:hypothetical protein
MRKQIYIKMDSGFHQNDASNVITPRAPHRADRGHEYVVGVRGIADVVTSTGTRS